MEVISAINDWITDNESLLSGAAALIVLMGVVISVAGLAVSRFKRSGVANNQSHGPAEPAAVEAITIKQLSAPGADPVHFAQSDGIRLAYSVIGSGELDIVLTPGIISHLNISANLPPLRDTLRALTSFARVTQFDKRGQGLSDPTLEVPDLDTRVRDIAAVMDAAGVQKAVLFGVSEGGAMCLRFAHDYPERVQGLVLLGSTASWLQREDFPIGLPEAALDAMVSQWGTGSLRHIFFPSIDKEQMDDQTYIAFEKLVSTRSSVKQLVAYMKEVDVRPLLATIHCPCLIIHYAGDLAVPIRMGRALYEGLPNAEFLEVNAVDHADLSQSPEAVERIREFSLALGVCRT